MRLRGGCFCLEQAKNSDFFLRFFRFECRGTRGCLVADDIRDDCGTKGRTGRGTGSESNDETNGEGN